MNLTVKRSLAATVGVSLILLAGCGSDSSSDSSSTTKAKDTTTTEAPKTEELLIEDAWARQSPMGATMGAAYMNITSPEDDKLLTASVSADIAKDAQIHETVMAGSGDGSDMSSTTTAGGSDEMTTTTKAMGAEGETSTTMGGGSDEMMMREVDSIELPAGEMVELKPGGYHIMLIELAKPLEVGQEIEITLEFEKAGTKTVTAVVKEG